MKDICVFIIKDLNLRLCSCSCKVDKYSCPTENTQVFAFETIFALFHTLRLLAFACAFAFATAFATAFAFAWAS